MCLISFFRKKAKLRFEKCIVILAGLPLTGKTTLGKELAKNSNLVLLDVDKVRQGFFPCKKVVCEEKEQKAMEFSYRKNHAIAKYLLSKNKPVILVATYSREFYHQMLKNLVMETQTPIKFFLLNLADEEVNSRLQKRQKEKTYSNIYTLENYLSVKNRYQKIQGLEVIELDASQPLTKNVELVFQNLINI